MASGTTPWTGAAGVERLWNNRNLTINGITVEPTLWFDGTGLSVGAQTWTCRQTGTVLSLTGAGADPTFDAEGPVNLEKAGKENGGKYFQAPNNTFGDITTEDFVLLTLCVLPSTVSKHIVSKRVALVGYDFFRDAAGFLGAYARSGAAATVASAVNVVSWYLSAAFIDRSGFGQMYVNGVASGAAVDVSGVGSLTTASPFCIGNYGGGGAFQTDGPIALVALYKQSNWLDTHLQPTLARQQHALYCGMEAVYSAGTATPTVL